MPGDAHELPFPDATFASVLAFGLLDRVELPKVVVAEVARVLAPGGFALVSCLHDCSGGPAKPEEWFDSVLELFAAPTWAATRQVG